MEIFHFSGAGNDFVVIDGRGAVAFADYLGIRPSSGGVFLFRAPDGLHVRTFEKGVEGETQPARWKSADRLSRRG